MRVTLDHGLWARARFDPMTMAMAAMGGGSVLSAIGEFQSAAQQKAIADANARAFDAKAEATRKAAGFEADRQRDEAEAVLSTQDAAFGASGVSLDTGSPLQVAVRTAEDAALDEMAIRFSGSVEEAQARHAAGIERARGRAAKDAAPLRAASRLLGGGGRIAALAAA